MKIIKLPYSEIPLFANRDVKYIAEVPALRPFYKYPVNLEGFRQAITDKGKESIDRETLVRVLRAQHSTVSISTLVSENIEKLALPNTFTVVTAHQPSLFTGPLYYIFKIVSAINLAKQLATAFPEFNFVPIFITSGEDHDFEKVNHLNIFGKKLEWQSGESGPVGNMKTESLAQVLSDLKAVLGSSEQAIELYSLIERIHTKHARYADAAFELAHELFKAYGLVVLNTNDADLKRVFAPLIKEEILNQPSQKLVNGTIAQLESVGFPSQATPRKINFFYLGEQYRERIVAESGGFKVLNTNLVFSRVEMAAEIEAHPARFSPNVVMRPIFQEKILPNLAYIGGGGELAYWLERKAQFDHFGLNFPVLVRRNSAMWIDAGSVKRMEKLGISEADIWLDSNELVRRYLHKNAESEFTLREESQALKAVFEKIAERTEKVDSTLVKTVWAEHSKAEKSIEMLEAKLIKAEKQKHETGIQQLQNLKEKLFPGGGLQERYENFMPLYLKHGKEFFEVLFEQFDPLEKQFVLIMDR
ncbi:MAG: bacillithiol biosynthesis cysteine-adding enzyme BshC [Saprospiraceae bacterium]|nr:bacillithiol biosynthesis cysteine-adding enzyme BshC [Saprospiraceae bacterium]